ncbi:hypothetical protein [Nocardioides convexus]|uniref:hypothetical protein n=1 Tax=Nocardioides convexus TaxID=2712224 RepID=UPI0024188044|nr:hypothetical protein [Nocardioides convexus]
MTADAEQDKVWSSLMRDMPIGMLTTFGPDGPRSVPMARQEVDPSAEPVVHHGSRHRARACAGVGADGRADVLGA